MKNTILTAAVAATVTALVAIIVTGNRLGRLGRGLWGGVRFSAHLVAEYDMRIMGIAVIGIVLYLVFITNTAIQQMHRTNNVICQLKASQQKRLADDEYQLAHPNISGLTPSAQIVLRVQANSLRNQLLAYRGLSC